MRTIAELCAEFDRIVIPSTASETQRREMRKAFYAGAHALFHMMVAMLDPGTEPTEDDLRAMDRIATELQAWETSVQAPRPSAGQA